jgi:hypothetical protein
MTNLIGCSLGVLLALCHIVGTTIGTRVFVSYAFYNGGIEAERNLKFFLNHGVLPSSTFDIEFGMVIKGECRCAPCEQPGRFLQDATYEKLLTVRQESNEGFDFGAHTSMLDFLAKEKRLPYDYYIFLNCGVIGPILPSFMPKSWHWASAFTEKMTDTVGLVGTSITCLPKKDRGVYGPKVEGFAFALSANALDVVRTHGTSFKQHETKIHAIIKGEYAMTNTIMEHKIGIDCLLLAYQGINWFNKKEWKCNRNKYPSRENTNHGISINPLEVLFHKEWWKAKVRIPVMVNYTEKYVQWHDTSLCHNRKRNGAARKAMIGGGMC